MDNEESIVKLGRHRLDRLGYKVEGTISPTEALDIFRTHPDRFDLVIKVRFHPTLFYSEYSRGKKRSDIIFH